MTLDTFLELDCETQNSHIEAFLEANPDFPEDESVTESAAFAEYLGDNVEG